MDLSAFFKLSYGLYVLSCACDGKQSGCIVNTVTQVTASPPQIAVAVNKQNHTAEMIAQAGCFNASVLTESADMELIGRFGFASGKERDKYEGLPFEPDELGIAHPVADVAAVLSAKVVGRTDLGSHLLFVGEVVGAKVLSADPVMTYSYYHQVKKGITPPKASAYQPPVVEKGWRCKICGYVHKGETVAADFACPVCGQKDCFERL